MYCLCEDESVIGRAFYVMEFMQGRVLWDQALPGMRRPSARAIYDEMNRVIAALHTVDFAARGLAGYGKPGNYFERQIGRWSKQYKASTDGAGPMSQPIPAMEKLVEWLPAHIPAAARDAGKVSIVHGDFRLDNLMFHPTEPRVIAVLDWELSTLGHPLADFSYHCMPGTSRTARSAASAGWTWRAGHPGRGRLHPPLLRPHRPDHRRRPEGRLELLHGLQHVPHRRHPAGHRQAGGGRHRVQRAGHGLGQVGAADGRTGLAIRRSAPDPISSSHRKHPWTSTTPPRPVNCRPAAEVHG
jgi:hypothetical protein